MLASRQSEMTRCEMRLMCALADLGVQFESHRRDLPGSPDIVIGDLAVFVHGCFWHGCAKHWKRPMINEKFWVDKVERNTERHARDVHRLRKLHMRTLTVWEHEDPVLAAGRIVRRLSGHGRGEKSKAV